MASTKPHHGTFSSGIPYARIGGGRKNLLLFLGGPGNGIPGGLGLQMLAGGFLASMQEYTVYLMTRKSGLRPKYTTRDMSDDYAELIQQEFGGHVDVVIGTSYGGMIAQHFAADHADLCDHLVIAMATNRLTDTGKQLDTRYAELLSQGKDRAAMATYAEVFAPPGVRRWLMTAGLWLLGGSFLGSRSSTFRQDVLVEVEAEVTHDAALSLRRVKAPVLVIVGGNDPFFPASSAQEMAGMMPSSTLKIYPGKGHDILNEKQFAQDVTAFIAAHPIPAAA